MRTLLLDCDFNLADCDNYTFQSAGSLYDFDLVVWDPAESLNRYARPGHSKYEGRPALDGAETVELKEAVKRRRQEFEEFLSLGRSLVVIASPREVVWTRTGQTEKSGTGRNQLVTNIVEPLDIQAALPFRYEATVGQGLELEATSPDGATLLKNAKGWLYRCTIDNFPGQPAMRVAGMAKVVSSVEVTEQGGFIALVPEPWVPAPTEAEDEDQDDRQDNARALVAWAQAKAVEDREPLPAWCADLRFESEVSRAADLQKAESSLARAAARVEKLRFAQAEDEQWKRLIASDGLGLEQQCEAAFKSLGFTVLEAEANRGDLRLEFDGQRVVVEVKGLSKSAAEKHAAQLEKWVAAEHADEVAAKGILVANAWRTVPPSERERAFPEQMMKYAIARGHCLITGLQLLSLVFAVRAGSMTAEAVGRLLIETVGVLEGFDEEALVFTTPTLTAED